MKLNLRFLGKLLRSWLTILHLLNLINLYFWSTQLNFRAVAHAEYSDVCYSNTPKARIRTSLMQKSMFKKILVANRGEIALTGDSNL